MPEKATIVINFKESVKIVNDKQIVLECSSIGNGDTKTIGKLFEIANSLSNKTLRSMMVEKIEETLYVSSILNSIKL